MSKQAELQAFLRFLTQDAKVPLATALSKVKQLQAAGLGSATTIAAAKLADVGKVFDSEGEATEKLAKQVHLAAKRTVKRKASDMSGETASPRKKQKKVGPEASPAEIEAALALPEAVRNRDVLDKVTLVTNRAPLVLAFAVTLLKYTMPEQPLSSRLSLAQAVVSLNSKSKAVSLGIDSGKTAEDEGWGKGQPSVRIMGREVKVLKRWGYDPSAKADQSSGHELTHDEETTKQGLESTGEDQEPALWGLDLEALKKIGTDTTKTSLPIHTAEAARAYLLKAFGTVATDPATKATKASKVVEEKEKNLGLLLGALEILYESWATLDRRELDRRAWSWYVKVRPEVEHGPSGWGGKGAVPLSAILDLKRP